MSRIIDIGVFYTGSKWKLIRSLWYKVLSPVSYTMGLHRQVPFQTRKYVIFITYNIVMKGQEVRHF